MSALLKNCGGSRSSEQDAREMQGKAFRSIGTSACSRQKQEPKIEVEGYHYAKRQGLRLEYEVCNTV